MKHLEGLKVQYDAQCNMIFVTVTLEPINYCEVKNTGINAWIRVSFLLFFSSQEAL